MYSETLVTRLSISQKKASGKERSSHHVCGVMQILVPLLKHGVATTMLSARPPSKLGSGAKKFLPKREALECSGAISLKLLTFSLPKETSVLGKTVTPNANG